MEIIPNWHPLFVHFTIALLLTAVLLFVIGKVAPSSASWRAACVSAARWDLCLGTLITVGTVIAGWYAYNTVHHDEAAHIAMTDHRNWALITALVFVVLALWSVISRKREPALIFVLCMIVAAGLLAATGYKGGELVYRHGLGVMALPEPGEHHHHGGHEDRD